MKLVTYLQNGIEQIGVLTPAEDAVVPVGMLGLDFADMAELAVITKKLDFHLEQVQDFTPTPMTVATETWYTGYHPYTLQPVFSAKTPKEKLAQRMFFFWYKPEERRAIINELRKIGRADLIDKLYGKYKA